MANRYVEIAQSPAFLYSLLTLCIVWAVVFTVRLIRWRSYIRSLRDQGLPMPPHSFIFGHIGVVASLLGQLPKDAHPFYVPDQIRRNYPDLGPNYYVDLWPFAPSMLVAVSPHTLYQITHEHVLHKYPNLKDFLRPLTDALDIVTMEGSVWKKWRGVFNPGFSASHLINLVPAIVKETETYCQLLEEHASKQDIFKMKDLTDNLTLDVIGRVALDTHLNCQREKNDMVNSLRTQVRWMSFGIEQNPFARHNPFRPLVQWYHSRIVNSYVSKELDRRYAMHRDGTASSKELKRTRTIIDLALSTYNEDPSTRKTSSEPLAMDPFFKRMCMSQIKLFLFSGHDTTSSAVCFHLYLLSQNPAALSRLQEEHTSIFGTDPSQASKLLSNKPHLINQLPYTTAVIKESLRIFPTVTNSRIGEPNFHITDQAGHRFPTEGFLVFCNIHTPQHDPAYWPEPQRFMPKRWLVAPGDPLYPTKGAWRAFEHGPRGCIGQELAMLEMKTVLVMVARRLRVVPAYEEVFGKRDGVLKTVHGEKAYQVELMQPRGDLPCRVEMLHA